MPDSAKPSIALAKRDAQLVAEFGAAKEAVVGFGKGGRVIGLTKGQFSLIDLIKALLQITGPAHLTLSTWTAGVRDVENIGFLVERGELLSLRLLVNRSFPQRQPQYVGAVRRVFGDDAVRITRTHAKFAILRAPGWDVIVRSSMNLNRNRQFENFDIDDDARICDHFEALVSEMFDAQASGFAVPLPQVELGFDRSLGDTVTQWDGASEWDKPVRGMF